MSCRAPRLPLQSPNPARSSATTARSSPRRAAPRAMRLVQFRRAGGEAPRAAAELAPGGDLVDLAEVRAQKRASSVWRIPTGSHGGWSGGAKARRRLLLGGAASFARASLARRCLDSMAYASGFEARTGGIADRHEPTDYKP